MARCAACFEQPFTMDEPCAKCGFRHGETEQGDALPIGTLLRERFAVGAVAEPSLPFGFHYRAWDKEFDNAVRLFEYCPKGIGFRDERGLGVHVRDDRGEMLFDTGLKGFESQIALLQELSHPCLVKIRTTFHEYGTFYVAKEPVLGVSLKAHLAMRRLTEGVAVHQVMPMLAALSQAHKAELLHGNIQPGVVRVSRSDHLVLDFFSTPFYQQARFVGDLRAGFNAAFRASGAFEDEIDAGDDVFSAGTLLAWMLNIQTARLQDAVTAEAQAPQSAGPEPEPHAPQGAKAAQEAAALEAAAAEEDPTAWLSAELVAVLREAVHRDPQQRFRTIDQLRAALSSVPAYQEYLQLQEPEAPPPRRVPTEEVEAGGLPPWMVSDWPWPAFGLGAMATILGVWQNTPLLVGSGMGLMGVGGLGGVAVLLARRAGRFTTPGAAPQRIAPWRNGYFKTVAAVKDGDDQGPIFGYLLEHFRKAEILGDLTNMQKLRDTFAQHAERDDRQLAAMDQAVKRQDQKRRQLTQAEESWARAVKVKDFDEMGRLLKAYQGADKTLYEQRRKQFGRLTKGKKKYVCKKVKMAFILIPAGSFLLGSNDGEANERPVTPVTLTRAFYMAKFPVTQGQWISLMKTKPWAGKAGAIDNPNAPATHVSHRQAVNYALKLNAALGVNQYRLPTEAEWEYACRAGHSDAWYFGHGRERLGQYAWFLDNTLEKGLTTAQQVGRKRNNVWGLYDMIGNVWEWCADSPWRYPGSAARDPHGDSEGFEYSVRGGSYQNTAWVCRVSVRGTNPADYTGPDQGFRLARNLE
ncbi:SUMF1/EgtB/PvdO family nonheme iron enzyme [Acanthopleuribacter pedis]|uniref:SUMF1/EgtB/PvdO family nonheme iron enzyme n=1 Tax=Acanthopleuribacter pedis TaxID=442870 RepID=A0A8J7Q4I0_9BACT|nr:SUMF1/EgtB/PvdO family nonheme iron enzyme [Acanthopleuribacter pedis]MBO1317611.1 SUMF1/EgtB/PvdO family nonheme iron enzyme [Acanthopleuribacter pedis]